MIKDVDIRRICGLCLNLNIDRTCDITGKQHTEEDECDCNNFELYFDYYEEG